MRSSLVSFRLILDLTFYTIAIWNYSLSLTKWIPSLTGRSFPTGLISDIYPPGFQYHAVLKKSIPTRFSGCTKRLKKLI